VCQNRAVESAATLHILHVSTYQPLVLVSKALMSSPRPSSIRPHLPYFVATPELLHSSHLHHEDASKSVST
jgi:hypothetical protein